MFIHRPIFLSNLFLLTGAAVFVISAHHSVLFAEPIQFSTEKKPVESSSSKKESGAVEDKTGTSKFFRPYRPADTVSGSMDTPFSAPMTQPQSSPPPFRSSKQNEAMMDRRRNWIFAQPGDDVKKGTAEEALGIDDFTSGGKKSQTMIGRFLENKKPDDSKLNGMDRHRPGELKELGFQSEVGFNEQKFQNEEPKETKPGVVTPSALRAQSLSGFGAEQSRLAEIWMEQHGPDAKRIREQKQVMMNEFESLFGSAKQTTPIANGLGQGNIGVQPILPLAPGSGLNPLPAASQIAEQSRSARALSASGTPTLSDVNSRLFGPSSVATPLPAPQRVESQPIILPFPKRRF